jgi:hypothetical protein
MVGFAIGRWCGQCGLARAFHLPHRPTRTLRRPLAVERRLRLAILGSIGG